MSNTTKCDYVHCNETWPTLVGKRYCNRWCSTAAYKYWWYQNNIKPKQVVAHVQKWPPIKCALPECDKIIQPKNDAHKYCSTTHQKRHYDIQRNERRRKKSDYGVKP